MTKEIFSSRAVLRAYEDHVTETPEGIFCLFYYLTPHPLWLRDLFAFAVNAELEVIIMCLNWSVTC